LRNSLKIVGCLEISDETEPTLDVCEGATEEAIDED